MIADLTPASVAQHPGAMWLAAHDADRVSIPQGSIDAWPHDVAPSNPLH